MEASLFPFRLLSLVSDGFSSGGGSIVVVLVGGSVKGDRGGASRQPCVFIKAVMILVIVSIFFLMSG